MRSHRELIRWAPASSLRIGRTNNRASSIAAMQTTKMIAVVDSTRVRVNVDTGANASEVSILAMIDQCSPRAGRPVHRPAAFRGRDSRRGDQRAALAALRQSGRFGRHRLHQRGAALPDRPRRPRRAGCPPRRRRACNRSGFSRNSRESDRIRSSGPTRKVSPVLPMPGRLPLLVDRHQPVDLRDRELQRQHAFDAPVRPDRRHHPGGGLVGRLVVAEVGDADIVDGVGGECFLVGVAQVALPVRAGQDVGAEVDALVGGVDDVAAAVEQQRVLEAERGARSRGRSRCSGRWRPTRHCRRGRRRIDRVVRSR